MRAGRQGSPRADAGSREEIAGREPAEIAGRRSHWRPEMIERVIEWSIRNRFLVLIVAAALSVAGVFAVYYTSLDAVSDLSENQTIVFADWMVRSPREIEDQVTYSLSRELQG